MFIFILIVLVLVALALYIFLIAPTRCKPPFSKIYYAHRGLHDNSTDAPENSLRSFELAVENGYGIELDVQLSADKEVVVFHDETLLRICGVDKTVAKMQYSELSTLPLLGTDQTVPRLVDVLAVIDEKIPVIVEIKPHGDLKELCRNVDRVLSEYKGEYCIESFHPDIITWYKKNRPEIVRGQLSEAFKGYKNLKLFLLRYLLTNINARPHFVAYNHLHASNFSFRLCRGILGAFSVAWTIKSQAELDKARPN